MSTLMTDDAYDVVRLIADEHGLAVDDVWSLLEREGAIEECMDLAAMAPELEDVRAHLQKRKQEHPVRSYGWLAPEERTG